MLSPQTSFDQVEKTARTAVSQTLGVSRREVLKIGAATAGCSAFSLACPYDSLAEDKEEKAMNYIDAHVHVWTPDTEKYPLAKGYQKSDMKPPSFTPEELMAHAKPCGVSRVVLIQMSFYGFDNSYMLDVMHKFEGVYSGVAVIDEDDSPAERMRELKKQGVRGFRIRPEDAKPDAWLKTDGMRAMWKCGAEENLAMCHLINPEYLPAVAEMCREFGDTPVVVDHFARIGVDGTIRKSDLENLRALAKFKTTSVKVSAYYALGKKKAPYADLGPMIRQLLDAYGPERLMWASDCPFQVQEGHEYAPSIDLIKGGLDFLSKNDRDWILRGTAARVFFGES